MGASHQPVLIGWVGGLNELSAVGVGGGGCGCGGGGGGYEWKIRKGKGGGVVYGTYRSRWGSLGRRSCGAAGVCPGPPLTLVFGQWRR